MSRWCTDVRCEDVSSAARGLATSPSFGPAEERGVAQLSILTHDPVDSQPLRTACERHPE